MGHPAYSLKRNLRRLDYALEKFGITRKQAGVTGHGLRHGNLNDYYATLSGSPSPVRDGWPVPKEVDRAAWLAVAEHAGHSRMRASGAYLGSSAVMRSQGLRRGLDVEKLLKCNFSTMNQCIEIRYGGESGSSHA